MGLEPPPCPICGTPDEEEPDRFGVYSCASCAIEFRPERRVPIRQATVAAARSTTSDNPRLFAGIVIVGVVVGGMLALGRHEGHTPPPPELQRTLDDIAEIQRNLETLQTVPQIHNQMREIDFSQLTHLSAGRLELEHETHRSTMSGARLYATGTLVNDSAGATNQLSLRVSVHDGAGTLLEEHEALVACGSLDAGDRCPWMVDAPLAAGASELRVHASGVGTIRLPELDFEDTRWFDDEGQPRPSPALADGHELDFDPREKVVRWTPPANTRVLIPWISVTALDEDEQVLSVARTKFDEEVASAGEATPFAVEVATSPADAHGYRVDFGGMPLAGER